MTYTLSTNFHQTFLKAKSLSGLSLRRSYRDVMECEGQDHELACFGDMVK